MKAKENKKYANEQYCDVDIAVVVVSGYAYLQASYLDDSRLNPANFKLIFWYNVHTTNSENRVKEGEIDWFKISFKNLCLNSYIIII